MTARPGLSSHVRSFAQALGLASIALAGAAATCAHERTPAWARDAVEVGVVPEVLPGALPWVAAVPQREPANELGERILRRLRDIQDATVEGRYAHVTHVDVERGRYIWDCSGMTAWVLRRETPTALESLRRRRPRARDFARHIARAPTDEARRGWRRIVRVEDVRAGDVFAWERPEALPSRNTGHVGFVASAPVRVLGAAPTFAVRVIDSTTLWHDADTRAAALDRDGGLGEGTMTFVVDEDGAATAYGWVGTLSPLYVVTPVYFGRLE